MVANQTRVHFGVGTLGVRGNVLFAKETEDSEADRIGVIGLNTIPKTKIGKIVKTDTNILDDEALLIFHTKDSVKGLIDRLQAIYDNFDIDISDEE